MKTLQLFFILISVYGMISCERESPEQNYNADVEKYIILLKANQYDSVNLPAFTSKDIPALLKYRNETQIISNFPHNPISSLWTQECTLGMYVLWTIESIRAVAINSEYLILRFPSQNPILALKASEELSLVDDKVSQTIAAQAYYNWWHIHMSMNFNDLKNIDPLAETDYRWH